MGNHTCACPQCGQTFTSVRSDAIYCNQVCRYRHIAGTPPQRQCLSCGDDISGRMANAKYCRPCYRKRENQKARERLPKYTHCVGCGLAFNTETPRRFCTQNCAGKHNRAKQIGAHPMVCLACGNEFTAQDKRKRTCSTACHQWRLKHPDQMRVLARECRICETPFVARNGNQYCCCKECNRTARVNKRRALETGQFVEEVSRIAIAVRDKWTCQLCGKRVNKRLKYPHPLSQSLDHVVPIALGGEHSRANAQLAHLVCNIRKGSRLNEPQQLAMIG